MFVKNIQGTGETAMNVDCPLQASLKRSSSAPMINEISATMSVTSPSTTAPPRDAVTSFNGFSSIPRARRFSTSSPGNVIGIGIGPKLTPRVNQLRREECIDVVAGREVAHEKEIHSAMQISQSWEDLTFETEGLSFKDSSTESSPLPNLPTTAPTLLPQLKTDKQLIPKKIFDPLNLNLSPSGSPSCSSPSPTRSGLGQRQCYSPSLHAVAWKNGSLSPSPTRKAFATRRSLSPISIRPSCLGGTAGTLKRKFELDESIGMDRLLQPPIKRAFNLIMSYPSRAETTLNLFSTVNANSTGSIGTPESLSSADSPNFSNQLGDENSPSSSRTLLQSDDASMSDSNSDPQQPKSMESDVSNIQENPCGNDNR
ncbi:PREDICTED: protein FAM122A [Ceratosolen solmsi marchali]|uniref:Protein FAM122A n=1 Tax=Ceratosolen solmsi marchali TaxID=326594 RepID=A0AAJ7DU24_9HYME|nr:PREDICTED: protein FAM122A [Ceratosolen solmsi marchali]